MGSSFGNFFRFSIFGESHGEVMGLVIDHPEPGMKIDFEFLEEALRRRSPGKAHTSARTESDAPRIVSGLMDGFTTGAPLCLLIANENAVPSEYDPVQYWMRPSHADYPAYIKSKGHRDHRGGGPHSGRLTALLVAAGEIARQALSSALPAEAFSHIVQLASYQEASWDLSADAVKDKSLEALASGWKASFSDKEFPCADPLAVKKIIESASDEKDSAGGVVETALFGAPVGMGDPFFDSFESILSSLLFSIPSVKGVWFGSGLHFASSAGSLMNDPYTIDKGVIRISSNHNGGIAGGMTTGMPIVFSTLIRPTSSVGKAQTSVDLETFSEETRALKGRHDPCIVPRVIPVIEAAAYITLYECYLSERRNGRTYE